MLDEPVDERVGPLPAPLVHRPGLREDPLRVQPELPGLPVAAVREAAVEYERLVHQAEELTRLRAELQALRDRVTLLEQEVVRLRGGGKAAT